MDEADAEKVKKLLQEVLDRMSQLPPAVGRPAAEWSLHATARLIRLARDRLSAHLGSALFSDPALEIVLFLYEEAAAGRKTTVTDLATCDRVPTTTGLRYIAAFEQQGFLYRTRDEKDARRTYVDFTHGGREKVEAYLVDVADLMRS